MSSFISTADNPYNYFTQFNEWYAFDTSAGYNTLAYLARVAVVSPDFNNAMTERAINEAIDEILEYNITGNYIKVYDS